MNKELEALKGQANSATEATRPALLKQIEQKQKSFERTRQDAADDYQNQQNEVASRILQKMAPVMVKYAGRQWVWTFARHHQTMARRSGHLVWTNRRYHAARG